MTNSFADFKKARMIIVVGSNMTEAHPVAATFVKEAVLNGAELVVIDPRRTDLVDFATMHIQLKVGSDVALINGLMNVLISENLYDKEYVASCTTGFDELKRKLIRRTPASKKAGSLSPGVRIERVRLTETRSSWAEYFE